MKTFWRQRGLLLLTVALLLLVGPGCVSWDPIFRGSLTLLHTLLPH